MKKTKFIGILSGLLSVVMLLAICAGCGKPDAEGNGDTSGSAAPDVSDSTQDEQYDSNGYLRDELPPELTYGGVDINILGWNSEVTEYTAAGDSASAIDQAVFKRNETIQSRLDVKLKFDLSVLGHNSAASGYSEHVRLSVLGDSAYDIVSAHTGSIVACTLNGTLSNLGNTANNYIDFDKPWWSSSVMEASSIGNSFYFCTGDASTSFAQMIYCVYFNADMIESLSLTSPYDYVENNEWTYENMMQMGMNIYQDLNENNEVDIDDEIPLVGQYYDWPALLHGCGIQIVSKDNSGVFMIDPTIKGLKAMGVMDSLQEFVRLDGAMVATDKDIKSTFVSGRAMFYVVQSGAAARWGFGNNEFEYGCVPIPKYDSLQEEYYCAARQPISLFAIPIGHDAERTEMISAVLECYASEGYRKTTPVIFDQVMKGQSSANVKMTNMLILIRDSAYFDTGRLYSSQLGSICDKPGYYLRDNMKWENYINQEMPRVETLLGTLSDALIEVDN